MCFINKSYDAVQSLKDIKYKQKPFLSQLYINSNVKCDKQNKNPITKHISSNIGVIYLIKV